MVPFVFGLIFLLIAVVWFGFKPYYTETVTINDPNSPNYRSKTKVRVSIVKLGWIPLLLAVVLIVISCFTTISTRNVGVETSFGKTTGNNYSAGLHLKAPWAGVTEVDGTIHPEEYRGDSCIYVKIGDGGTACVSVAYRWRINPDNADKVFADYNKSDKGIDEAVRTALVSTNIKAAINEVFGAYDPLDSVNITADMSLEELANVKVTLPPLEEFNSDIEANVAEKIKDVGDLIDIQAVTISYVRLPEGTENRINAFNAAVQNTKIAIQEIATKEAQAEGNKKLAESLQDPNVLVSKCLDGLIAGDFTPPAGFSCSVTGGSSAVVIPAAK